jgi:hypothetical protein
MSHLRITQLILVGYVSDIPYPVSIPFLALTSIHPYLNARTILQARRWSTYTGYCFAVGVMGLSRS